MANPLAPASLFLVGMTAPVADIAGVRSWYVASGLICVLLGALGFLIPALLPIEEDHPDQQPGPTGLSPAAPGGQSRSTG